MTTRNDLLTVARKAKAEEIATRIIKDTKKKFGAGWDLLHKDIQWAVIAQGILEAMLAQDDDISGDVIVVLITATNNFAYEMHYGVK